MAPCLCFHNGALYDIRVFVATGVGWGGGLRQSFVVASAILAHNVHELRSGRNSGEMVL